MTQATRTQGLIDKVLDGTRERVRAHPLQYVTGAWVVGYVLGSGMPAFASRAAIGIGLRLLFARALVKGSDSNQ